MSRTKTIHVRKNYNIMKGLELKKYFMDPRPSRYPRHPQNDTTQAIQQTLLYVLRYWSRFCSMSHHFLSDKEICFLTIYFKNYYSHVFALEIGLIVGLLASHGISVRKLRNTLSFPILRHSLTFNKTITKITASRKKSDRW